MAMPMNSEARKPSANRITTATSSTPVATEFCRSASICRMIFDLSCVKVTCDGFRPGLLQLPPRSPSRASTVSIRLAPVRFDTSMVMAGLPLTRVTEVASLKVGLISATSPSVTAAPEVATTGTCSTSCGCSISAGTLTAKRPVWPSSAPAAIRLLKALVTGDELVERDAVALHQHRLGDDLDRLVAGAAQLGRQHARRLLDGVLGGAGDAQQRALRHVAGERHHQHRIEREVDLQHLRLVDVLAAGRAWPGRPWRARRRAPTWNRSRPRTRAARSRRPRTRSSASP